MSSPTSRSEFKSYCLRKLGAPVIEINVDDDQVEDRIDEALKYYWDYHFDGTERIYYKHQVTANNISQGYITLPENIIGAVRIFDVSGSMVTNNIFDIRYQIALNDMYTLTSVSMVPYYMAFQHIQLLEQLLVGQQPIRYNRHNDKLYVDMNWDKVNEGSFLIVEAYQILDPDEYTDAWSDRWLTRYATALIKKQWGNNLTKFTGMQLPGGVQFNGDRIYNDAVAEIEQMEKDMATSYSLPAFDMIG
jgi:hypothetical protein